MMKNKVNIELIWNTIISNIIITIIIATIIIIITRIMILVIALSLQELQCERSRSTLLYSKFAIKHML